MSNKNEVMVTVCIVTYNQEKWIRQTLDSVLAQQTDYPFEIIIGEDHGTDGTRAICQEYANKYDNVTLLPSPTNLGVTANWIQCIQAGTGRYIMTCAGDDWWHNPSKIHHIIIITNIFFRSTLILNKNAIIPYLLSCCFVV